MECFIIFVMAWCWFNATESKPQNVVKQFEMKTLTEIIRGLPKEVIEYLESNTELAKTAIESHKKDFSNNVKYIIIGFLFSLVPQGLSLLYKQSDLKQLKEQFDEINGVYHNLQMDIYQMRLENESLKNEIDSLKKSS